MWNYLSFRPLPAHACFHSPCSLLHMPCSTSSLVAWFQAPLDTNFAGLRCSGLLNLRVVSSMAIPKAAVILLLLALLAATTYALVKMRSCSGHHPQLELHLNHTSDASLRRLLKKESPGFGNYYGASAESTAGMSQVLIVVIVSSLAGCVLMQGV